MVKFHKMSPKMIIKKLILLMVVANPITFVFASSGQDWFDAPLKDCFEAIEEGKFLRQFKTKVMLAFPIEYIYPKKAHQKKYAPGKKMGKKTCGFLATNFFYDDKEYSLNKVLRSYKSGGNTYYCKKLNAKSYAFCEYAKHKNIKGVRPIY